MSEYTPIAFDCIYVCIGKTLIGVMAFVDCDSIEKFRVPFSLCFRSTKGTHQLVIRLRHSYSSVMGPTLLFIPQVLSTMKPLSNVRQCIPHKNPLCKPAIPALFLLRQNIMEA